MWWIIGILIIFFLIGSKASSNKSNSDNSSDESTPNNQKKPKVSFRNGFGTFNNCPHCQQWVDPKAKVCGHCMREI